jgi:hypothetical protein
MIVQIPTKKSVGKSKDCGSDMQTCRNQQWIKTGSKTTT